MQVTERLYLLAEKTADKSRHPKYKMGAAIYLGGSILSRATNSGRLQEHAEEKALRLAPNARGATIAIARVGGGTSKPCRFCLKLIKKAGIRRIIFIDNAGRLVEIRPENLNELETKDYCQPRMEWLSV